MIRAVANRINKSGTKSQSCQHTIPSNPVGENYDETGRDEKTQAEVEPTDHSRSSNPDIKSGKCQECAREKRAARGHRWKLIIGLMPAYFLASLDVTIVATALPFIASHFNKFNQLNWIVTAFTLTSTTFIPTFGQLADLFGRHATFHFALVFMIVGSVLCTAAVNWPMLLLGRGFQGVGAAGIMNLVMIILADSVSLKEQAKTVSIFQLVNGIGYSVGPIIGGYITNVNWRYCFVISIGLPIISHISLFFLLRKDLKPGTFSLSRDSIRGRSLQSGLSELDFGGTILFILGSGLIILGTAWGGATYPWSSAAVLVSLVAGSIIFISFFIYEYLLEPGRLVARILPRTHPMIPYPLFRRRDMGLMAVVAAAMGAALYSVFYFVGIYFTLVEGYQASDAGLRLLYYIPGIGIGVYGAIYLCNVRPRQTFWPVFMGTVIETTEIAVLTYAVRARRSTLVNGIMILAGAGTGLRMMPTNLHLAGVWPDQIAAVYSVVRFSLPFGGTLALTIMGSVFQNKMAPYFDSPAVKKALGNYGTGGFTSVHNQGALAAIANLPLAERARIRDAGANATMWAYVSILPLLTLSVLCSGLLGNVWISPRHRESPDQTQVEKAGPRETGEEAVDRESKKQAPSAPHSDVIDSIYLLALVRGTVKQERRPNVRTR